MMPTTPGYYWATSTVHENPPEIVHVCKDGTLYSCGYEVPHDADDFNNFVGPLDEPYVVLRFKPEEKAELMEAIKNAKDGAWIQLSDEPIQIASNQGTIYERRE